MKLEFTFYNPTRVHFGRQVLFHLSEELTKSEKYPQTGHKKPDHLKVVQ